MSKRSKTRFFATIDGVERVLVSVRERKDGSLVVMSGIPDFYEEADGTLLEYVEQHYSVHRTNESKDTSITKKTTLSGGKSYSNVTYIGNTTEHLLWPIFARRPPILRTESTLLRRRPEDVLLSVSSYSVTTASLCYSVFVAKKSMELPQSQLIGLDVTVAEFKEFKVIVIPMYLNGPAISRGDVVGMTTSMTVVNGVRRPDHLMFPATSFGCEQLMQAHMQLMQMLFSRFHARLENIIDPNDPNSLMLKKVASEFTNRPLLLSL